MPDRGAEGLTIAAAAAPPDDWRLLLAADPAADYSHTPHWTESAAATLPGARPLWLTAREGDRLLGGVAAVLRDGGSRLTLGRLELQHAGVAGGPLVDASLPPERAGLVFDALLAAALRQRPRWPWSVGLVLNFLHEERFGGRLRAAAGWRRVESPTAMIPLDGGPERVAAERFSMNKRNERNRGLRRGAVVEAVRDAAALAEYYPLYEQACAHWGHEPTPLAFLQRLLADPGGRVFFTCVRLDGKVIGGHLNLHYGDRVLAWNGVSDPAYARSHFPATLCFWGDVIEACRLGARCLDLGASGGIQSLGGFKRYFGAETRTRGYYRCEGAGVPWLRGLREGWSARRSGAGGRWHDGRTGRRRRGGPA
jgi:hypothetical protein